VSGNLGAWYDDSLAPATQRLDQVLTALNAGIRTHSPDVLYVSGRVKTRTSFLEKANRKGYASPSTEIQDLVGTRVVVRRRHRLEDAHRAIKAVASAQGWSVIGEEQRGSEAENAHVPGYQAVHLILQTDPHDPSTTVEVQIMTMLQNAWAVLQHDLVYKGTPDPVLSRRATSLAGLLELAEKEFEDLRLAVSGGLRHLPERLERDHDVETLVSAICDVPVGPSAEGRTNEWAEALLQVIRELDLTERDRLLDALGDPAERAELVRMITEWRPWMNGYLVVDFVLRLKVPDYFDRRHQARRTKNPDARAAFDAEIGQLRAHTTVAT
jgi:ppGpp synthetase/RelA/SpoT-type nucleotidyltranferase